MAKRGRKPGSKAADKAEVARRVARVEELLVAEEHESVIKARLSVEWKCGVRNVERYIETARRQWAREVDPPHQARKTKLRRKAKLLYRKGVEGGKLSAAVSALKMEAALDGIATDRIEHSGPGGGAIPLALTVRLDLSALTDEELDALDRIARKLDDGKPGPASGADAVLPERGGDPRGGAGGEGAPVG